MILYMENLKDHLETVKTNQYIQVARYKINMQKSFVFLYNNNKVSKKKALKRTILFTIALKHLNIQE